MCVFCVNDIAFICVSALLQRTITSHLKGQSASTPPLRRTYACSVYQCRLFPYLHLSVCIFAAFLTSTYLSLTLLSSCLVGMSLWLGGMMVCSVVEMCKILLYGLYHRTYILHLDIQQTLLSKVDVCVAKRIRIARFFTVYR